MANIFSDNILWSLGSIFILFGIIAAHRLMSSRDKKNSVISASNDIVSAFAPAIARLDAAILHVGTHESPEVNEFLKENFEIHSAAVEKFSRIIIGKRKRNAFKKAWDEYCELEPNHGYATGFAGHYSADDKYLEFIKDKIENILKFAKHT